MGSKKPADKATVSFSSDSDEDDSSSSSSRLSSSAESSGEDSEVETATFTLPSTGQGSAKGGAAIGAPAAKVESKTGAETKKTDPVKPVSPEPRKSPVSEAVEKSAVRKTKVSDEELPNLSKKKLTTSDSAAKELRKSPGKLEETGSERLGVKKSDAGATGNDRPKSPKIKINDVEEETPKKSPQDDVTVTSSSKVRGASPRKTSNDIADVEPGTEEGGRAVSPRKDTADDDLGEVTKKRSSKLSAERAKSPKDTAEEPVAVPDVKSTDRAKSPRKTTGDKERSKSPRETSEETDSAETSKSPKKILDTKDTERAKSPKKISEERVIENPKPAAKTLEEKQRDKSPKKTGEEENVERETSPRTSSKDGGEVKKKSSKDSSKTPYELLRSVESPEKSPTRSTKPKKLLTTDPDSSSTPPKRKSPLKDLEVKDLEAPDAVEPAVKPKKASKKAGKSILTDNGADEVQTQKTGVSETKDPSDTSNEVELLLKEIRQKRLSQTSDQPDLELAAPESGNKLIHVTVDEPGKTDNDASKVGNSEQKEGEGKDKDYMKVSRNPGNESATATTGSGKPELENEESEFTYRRKSMDDFIKRILAEAKEERQKQKHGGGGSPGETTEDEKKTATVDRNGDITENGLGGEKWSSGEKEGSMLDRRLAKIEKRRFGGSSSDAGKKGEGEVGRVDESKVGKETEEDGTTSRTTKLAKETTDNDVNLDEDLEEINRFLQSRKTAASRFDFDEPGLKDDAPTAPSTTTTKRRWAAGKDQPPEEEDLPSPGGPRSQIKKKYSTDLDFNDDDESFLGRFKRDRDSALPEESFSPRRRDETSEIIRERTRNVRVLVDQQVEIVQAMRTTSKSLDELEKEIREVRQVCLNRQARIEALEGALGAEYRAFESDQKQAADGLSARGEDFGVGEFGQLRRQDKYKSESLNEENFPFRRRSGSVASTTSYTSGFESSSRGGGGGGRLGDGSNDGLDSRPPSGLKRDLRRTSETESDFSSTGLIDRRRGGSAARDRGGDVTPFGPDDPMTNAFLSQRSARSRASIATSTPAVDYAGTISGDSFLAKIRAKYSFLGPSLDATQGYSSPSTRSSIGSSSYASPSSLTYGRRIGSRDILSSSSSPYSSLGGYSSSIGGSTTGSRYSIRDSYGIGGYSTGISSSYGDSGRMRRAQSVSDVSFDRPTASPTNLGSGEFHSRFLDKVRGKKAMGDDAPTTYPTTTTSSSSTANTKGQEKPFKSRFLKTTSFDAGSSRSERLTNGFEDGGEHGKGGSSEVNGNA